MKEDRENAENTQAVAKQYLKTLSLILYDAICEAGDQGIPSGHLYAMISDKLNLTTYQIVIRVLTETNWIENKNHLLRAKRGKRGEESQEN